MDINLQSQLPESVYFITGIDTDCGKTMATGYISRTLLSEGCKVITQKLIQTGCPTDSISEDIMQHRHVEGRPTLDVDDDHTTCPLIYTYPCSPHMAIAIDGKDPDFKQAEQSTERLSQQFDKVLIEGAGGLMVPLTTSYLTRDYIVEHDLPVILVTTARLGSINHTLLNIELMQRCEITIGAIAYNTAIATDSKITNETRSYLKHYLDQQLPHCTWIEIPKID